MNSPGRQLYGMPLRKMCSAIWTRPRITRATRATSSIHSSRSEHWHSSAGYRQPEQSGRRAGVFGSSGIRPRRRLVGPLELIPVRVWTIPPAPPAPAPLIPGHRAVPGWVVHPGAAAVRTSWGPFGIVAESGLPGQHRLRFRVRPGVDRLDFPGPFGVFQVDPDLPAYFVSRTWPGGRVALQENFVPDEHPPPASLPGV